MDVRKIGAQIVINNASEYPGKEMDITSMHTRSKVTATHTVITDLANSNFTWSCANADFLGEGVAITTQETIKAFLRPIIGS